LPEFNTTLDGLSVPTGPIMDKLINTQIDQLGNRLRKGSPTENDLILLNKYRGSFTEAYESVITVLREQLQLEPTGRPAKSTHSIIEKLQRESIRLSQVQDIAGCRVVVAGMIEQDRAVMALRSIFADVSVVDRRKNPSYGYRAVHIIPRISVKLIEIQIRTQLQHLWAELSERLSDRTDPAIKYGGGPKEVQQSLAEFSKGMAMLEVIKQGVIDLKINVDTSDTSEERKKRLEEELQKAGKYIMMGAQKLAIYLM